MIDPRIKANLKLGFTADPNATKYILVALKGSQSNNEQIVELLTEWLGDRNQTGDVGVSIGTGVIGSDGKVVIDAKKLQAIR